MTDAQITAFIEQSRTATMATIARNGSPHLVAMWYGVVDGEIWFETKARSQKVQNRRRNDRLACMIEDGLTYDVLRGVSLEGRGVIVEDRDAIWRVGLSLFERYTAPYEPESKPLIEAMVTNRIAVRLDVERVRSWDHHYLGMDPMPVRGSTAKPVGAND